MGSIVQVQQQTATGSGTSLSVTLPNPVTAGNRIVVIAASRGPAIGTTGIGPDSRGNAYSLDFSTFVSPIINPSSPDAKLLEMYSTAVVTGGSVTITYTLGLSDTNITLVAEEWSGLYALAPYGGGPGAAWIDHGAAEGAAPFPPLTLNFATDFPPLATFYGTTLPLVAVIAAYDRTLIASYQLFPNATGRITSPFPSYPLFDVAVGICVLYVGSTLPVTVNCSITINAGNLSIVCSTPPVGSVGSSYFYQIFASGGVPPYTFSVLSGALPPGITLNATTGILSGTPTFAGSYSFVIQVADSMGATATCPETLTIVIIPTGCIDPNSGSGLQSERLEVAPPTVDQSWWITES